MCVHDTRYVIRLTVFLELEAVSCLVIATNYPSARPPQTVEELEALGLAIEPLNFPMKRLTQERK